MAISEMKDISTSAQPTNEIDKAKVPIFKGKAAFLDTPVRRISNFVIQRMFSAGDRMTSYENVTSGMEELSQIATENALILVAFRHASHSDIVLGHRVISEIRTVLPWINRFYVPVAASLSRGIQGPIAQLLYSEGTVPFLVQQNAYTLPLVTENDQKKRRMKPDRQEARRLHNAVTEKNSAFLVFVEGSVEGGRHDLLGHEKGIQRVTNPFLAHVFRQAQKEERKIIILPVATTDTSRLLSAEHIIPTCRSALALLEDWVLKRPATLARATLGHPFEYQNQLGKSPTDDPEEVNKVVMSSIAALEPLPLKGYYDPATSNYQASMKEYTDLLGSWHQFLHKHHSIPRSRELEQLAKQYSVISAAYEESRN